MKEFIGKVYEKEIDYGNDLDYITVVRDEKNNYLSDLLIEFEGEVVKITIEKITQDRQ